MRSSIATITLSAVVLAASSAWADPPPPASPPPPVQAGTSAEAPAPPVSATDAEEERTANNAIYLEGLGPGLLYSVNYDRSFGDFAGRVGFGYLSLSVTGTSDSGSGPVQETSSASFFTVPITVSYLGVGSKRNMLELGAGATIVHVGAGASAIDAKSSTSENAAATFVFPVGIVGYRYQPPHGGFLFRAGLSPIFGGSTLVVLPLPYLALGGVF